jgi:hypothetical protein
VLGYLALEDTDSTAELGNPNFFLRYPYEVTQPETRKGTNRAQPSSQNYVVLGIMNAISIWTLNNALRNLVLRYSRIGSTVLSFVRAFRNFFSLVLP